MRPTLGFLYHVSTTTKVAGGVIRVFLGVSKKPTVLVLKNESQPVVWEFSGFKEDDESQNNVTPCK